VERVLEDDAMNEGTHVAEPGPAGESRSESDLISRALILALTTTQMSMAWHAGEMSAESAMWGISTAVQTCARFDGPRAPLRSSRFSPFSDVARNASRGNGR
jgi:hypothetical protein